MILMASVLLSRHSWQIVQLYPSSSDRMIPPVLSPVLSLQSNQTVSLCGSIESPLFPCHSAEGGLGGSPLRALTETALDMKI